MNFTREERAALTGGSGRGARCLLAGLLALACLLAGAPARAEPSVTLTDLGWENECAEMDNVLAALSGSGIQRFTITARHPDYAGAVADASSEADFSDCAFPDEPIWDFEPADYTLYEDERIRLDGHRLPKSWRPELVPVTVGDRTWPGLHLLQLKVWHNDRWIEVLVLYPSDGYWRPKPLPFRGHEDTPYGASMLIGPVEIDRRPLVKLDAVRFDPSVPRFTLDFVAGGSATVTVVSISTEELRLEVEMTPPAGEKPFALVSSMYVEPGNADIGRVAVRPPGSPFWQKYPPVGFPKVEGAVFAFGRDIPSRHNTLAPDIRFGGFKGKGAGEIEAAEPPPAKPQP